MNVSDLIEGKSYKVKHTKRLAKLAKYKYLDVIRYDTEKFLHMQYGSDRFVFERSNGRRYCTTQYFVENNVFEL